MNIFKLKYRQNSKAFCYIFSLFFILFLVNACTGGRKAQEEIDGELDIRDLLKLIQEEGSIVGNSTDDNINLIEAYHPSPAIQNELVHTVLDLRFDWEKAHVLGKASLTIQPYFYPVNELILDAKGMDIHRVELLDKNKQSSSPSYEYVDDLRLKIRLDKTYQKGEQYKIKIDYTAKPNELQKRFDFVNDDELGIYFINPKGEIKDQPQQIWTQGETENASCWFPTIDAPNQKSSQEVYITVQDKYITLSNGKLMRSTKNTDGTRTDYWKQDLPHTPYLFMVGIGDFAIVKDYWKGKDVFYYVEPEYEAHAKAIFGKTPKMLTAYSEILGIEYPWEKYSQIIVRDFVSGAMENTGAVVYGDFVQKTSRELLDEDYEDYISHELFHHWFGNLVTCESWANLPINEAFATYGEYLWDEYEYGLMEAGYNLEYTLDGYLYEAKEKQQAAIRFYYEDPDDLFDSHAYNKGGCILHLLRKYVGDEAFFASLKLFLEEHQYQTAEIHDVRQAFEKITGEDLNWFFNQWFLSPGHPVLDINYAYSDSSKTATVFLEQIQDRKKAGLFKLPLKIDIYFNETDIVHEEITMTKAKQKFVFPAKSKPLFINLDADKALVGEKKDNKSTGEWIAQYYHAPLYLDKKEALSALISKTESEEIKKVFLNAIQHEFWGLRNFALENYLFKDKTASSFQNLCKKIALQDPVSKVRAVAIEKIGETGQKEQVDFLYDLIKKDSSFLVMNNIINALAKLQPEKAVLLADEYINTPQLSESCLRIYQNYGDKNKSPLFEKMLDNNKNISAWKAIDYYTNYTKRYIEEETILSNSIYYFHNLALNHKNWYRRGLGMKALSNLYEHLHTLYQEAGEKEYHDKWQKTILEKINDVKSKEKNKHLINQYRNF